MTTITNQINQAIADAGGNVRDALNNALAGRDAAMKLLRSEQTTVALLLTIFSTIRDKAVETYGAPVATLEDINRITREALDIMSSVPTTTEEG